MPIKQEVDKLRSECLDTLEANTVRGESFVFTAPDINYYPHQWLWDSAITAQGWALSDPHRGAKELWSLVDRGQWDDGMIPNQILNGGRGENWLWRSRRSPNSPSEVRTSGITQPPILAEASFEIAKRLPSDERSAFVVSILGRLASYHSWLHTTRNFSGDGLASVVHPYETGMDNNPALMHHIVSTIIYRGIGLAAIRAGTAMARRDAKTFEPNERASLEETTLCTASLLNLRKLRYDQTAIKYKHAFQVESVHFNSALARNDDVLQTMASQFDYPLNDDLLEHMAKTKTGLQTLWDEQQQKYFSRDAVTSTLLKVDTIASLMPLYAGELPPGRQKSLVDQLNDPASFGADFMVPSTPLNSLDYKQPGYWNGSVWPFTNQLLASGLARLGHDDLARRLDYSIILSVLENGPREYFSAQTGVGYGTDNFSPTAATVLLALNRQKASLLASHEQNLKKELQAGLNLDISDSGEQLAS